MLKDSFYIIEHLEKGEDSFFVRIKLNSEHPIFKGHFPGEPIMPGVTMVKICEELISEILGQRLEMSEARQIKFLAIINPEHNAELRIKANFKLMEANVFSADFTFINQLEVICFKMKSLFSKQKL
jgi:3-hydroxyacyl-[acyl-carrier-protein] dehydratase